MKNTILKLKSISIIYILFLLLCSNILSQELWTPTNGPTSERVYDILYINEKQRLVAACEGGIFISEDDGNMWYKSKGLRWGFKKLLRVSENSILAIPKAFTGIYISKDYGTSWYLFGENIPNSQRDITKNSKGELFLITYYSVFFSSDSGENWIKKDLPSSIKFPLSIASTSNDILIMGTSRNGILRSLDKGSSWKSAYPDNKSEYWPIFIDNKDSIFIGSKEEGILFSTDFGKTWSVYKDGLPIGSYIFTIKKDDNDNMYAIIYRKGLYYTNSNLKEWKLYNVDLPNVEIKSILVNSNNDICFGTNYGLYKENSMKSTLIPLNTGLTSSRIDFIDKSKANIIISGNFDELFDLRHPRSLLSICHSLLDIPLNIAKKIFIDNPNLLIEKVQNRTYNNSIESGIRLIKGGELK